MATKPTIYVLAGANGVGKTTVNPFFIPKNVPYVNADDFAYQLRQRLGNDVNVQELANAEALEQMNIFIAKRKTFAIETNLADNETWLFLIGIQGLGYDLHLNFFGVSDVEICINRVRNRVLQGGHYVRPDIVIARYKIGLGLLKHYKNVPNKLVLTDNRTTSINCVEMSLGEIVFQNEALPKWVEHIISDSENKERPYNSLDDVRAKYRKLRNDDNDTPSV
jgi:predicted ABC-type ATPase